MKEFNPELLKRLCSIHAPSGNETDMKVFLLDYINQNSGSWMVRPEVLHGDEFQNCIVLIFGKPTTAVFAHIDSIGFTVGYENNLIRIGGPKIADGYILTGHDSSGPVECSVETDEESGTTKAVADRTIDPGTDLVFKCDFRTGPEFVQLVLSR